LAEQEEAWNKEYDSIPYLPGVRRDSPATVPPVEEEIATPRQAKTFSTTSRSALIIRVVYGTTGEFTIEDLIVLVWEKNKQQFGLEGYEEKYPDSQKVKCVVYGNRGLARSGYLVKTGRRTYVKGLVDDWVRLVCGEDD
jgi:hypothetical protein